MEACIAGLAADELREHEFERKFVPVVCRHRDNLTIKTAASADWSCMHAWSEQSQSIRIAGKSSSFQHRPPHTAVKVICTEREQVHKSFGTRKRSGGRREVVELGGHLAEAGAKGG